ncbi:hypothetical protein Holit_00634 [Hollandina sp. SP2]
MQLSFKASFSIGILVCLSTLEMAMIASRIGYPNTEKSLQNQPFSATQLVTDGIVHAALGKDPLFFDKEIQNAAYRAAKNILTRISTLKPRAETQAQKIVRFSASIIHEL